MPVKTSRPNKLDENQALVNQGHNQTQKTPCSPQDYHISLLDMKKSRRNSPGNRSQRSAHTSDSSDKSYITKQTSDGSRPTRKRASKPKVRTGCISCKRRHVSSAFEPQTLQNVNPHIVKCDEGKPSCAECERLGLMCEGYAPPKTKIPASRPERLLLPKPKLACSIEPSNKQTMIPPQSTSHRPLASSIPSFGFELDEEDKWYFSLFRDQISHELSPYYRSEFWCQTSLRDSMINKCVHHSILSIGAYGRALMDLRNEYSVNGKTSRPWWPPSVLNRHHQAALVHHAKALSHLRSTIGSYGVDSRLTLAATLLFIVFENMQGNYHSSGNLIRSGIKVLTNIRGRGSDSRSILRRQWHRYMTAPRDEVDEMTNMFARHSVASAYIPFSHGKFAYHMLFTEDESDDVDLGLASPFTFTVPQTLEQARQIWDYLAVQLANFQSKIAWHNLNPDFEFDETVAFREQATYLALLNDLGVGLGSLLFSTTDNYESQGLELLRLHHSTAVIAISCCLDPTEMMYDDFLPQFEDVVQRCRIFADFPMDRSMKVGFTNETGMLPLLAFVGAKCRTAAVRSEAVELMRCSDWREGNWDGSSLANAVTGIMRLEGQLEVSNSGYIVPAKARYTWSNVFWDFEKQEMHVEYTKILPDAFGDFEKVRCVMGV
ncbi:uncharacterized protein F4822DRAFT_426554 [Hypoxylon trugodes]|uniref:uncharacterized protein n=1 Tax=Hypoxylon trugodes TaxID=326681 RepID=UPI0021952922|nr:uncharacterized protein F4822DRAFT_426554 [Hypoxylon trugodes]KAI1390706.1 hypothetical protein F4822DRAFT_426554 [Hypoxylon trugodes]